MLPPPAWAARLPPAFFAGTRAFFAAFAFGAFTAIFLPHFWYQRYRLPQLSSCFYAALNGTFYASKFCNSSLAWLPRFGDQSCGRPTEPGSQVE